MISYLLCLGVIDFGDFMDSYVVFEVATLMAYMMNKAWHDRLNPVQAASYAYKGFQSILPLNNEEKNLLYISVMKRFAVSACSGWQEKSLGASDQTLKDMHSMGCLAKTFWKQNKNGVLNKIFAREI